MEWGNGADDKRDNHEARGAVGGGVVDGSKTVDEARVMVDARSPAGPGVIYDSPGAVGTDGLGGPGSVRETTAMVDREGPVDPGVTGGLSERPAA